MQRARPQGRVLCVRNGPHPGRCSTGAPIPGGSSGQSSVERRRHRRERRDGGRRRQPLLPAVVDRTAGISRDRRSTRCAPGRASPPTSTWWSMGSATPMQPGTTRPPHRQPPRSRITSPSGRASSSRPDRPGNLRAVVGVRTATCRGADDDQAKPDDDHAEPHDPDSPCGVDGRLWRHRCDCRATDGSAANRFGVASLRRRRWRRSSCEGRPPPRRWSSWTASRTARWPRNSGLRAGAVDDNAAWDDYLLYRHRFLESGIDVHDVDVTGRRIVTVTRPDGSPVLGATVTLLGRSGDRTGQQPSPRPTGRRCCFPTGDVAGMRVVASKDGLESEVALDADDAGAPA